MKKPKVAVIMATYNPIYFIKEQIDSILNQKDVDITIHIFDDGSSDQTMLLEPSIANSKKIIVNQCEASGSAGKNFLRAIRDLPLNDFDWISISDQDDIWCDKKVISAINKLKESKANGYSSNLDLYDGKEKYGKLIKNDSKCDFDHYFQGASAGCTYVLDVKLFEACKLALNNCDILNLSADVSHDWAIYYICRTSSLNWYADSNSYILYRQHDNNVYGATRSVMESLKMIFGGWLYNNVSFMDSLNTEKNININGSKIYKLSKIVNVFSFRRGKIESLIAYFWWLFCFNSKK
ncbi:glycosyltransferase [Moritella sp. Urea-trap-13]|uniref:glycosyltransferase n=1 Tax=Moritella sp. Urea-trap-13 TaxID=2058327 RepID=UPI000C33C86F|nr:glycosyltransferase [Moritella sp. Urea-trap-13]PKH05306.1 glycosyl transferase family 2 [Moritella sp. Urea-trap-13]